MHENLKKLSDQLSWVAGQLDEKLHHAREAGINTSDMDIVDGRIVRRITDLRFIAGDQDYDPMTAWRH